MKKMIALTYSEELAIPSVIRRVKRLHTSLELDEESEQAASVSMQSCKRNVRNVGSMRSGWVGLADVILLIGHTHADFYRKIRNNFYKLVVPDFFK